MNGDLYKFDSSSKSTSLYNISSSTSKSNLLSSYLLSDDDEDDNNLATNFFSDSVHPSNERIEVLIPSSNHNLLNQCDSTGCDAKLVTETTETKSKYLPKHNVWSDDTIESSTPRRSQYRITFEIIKAKTVTTYENGKKNRFERKKYVTYTILIKRVPGLETKPAIIERRYSDFLNFYNAIKKKYPSLLKEILFPKKILIGNFSAEIISERSLAFQSFLTYCLSVPEIRFSKEFASFLYYPELKEAKKCLNTIHLEEAACLFENVYFIQDKLAVHSGTPSTQLIHTLCCLIGCLNALDNTAEAKKHADKTFEILFQNSIVLNSTRNNESVYEVNNLYESSPLVLPLILLSLRLRWFSGQRKLALENKLEEQCRKQSLPRNFDSQPTILEIILKRDFSPIID